MLVETSKLVEGFRLVRYIADFIGTKLESVMLITTCSHVEHGGKASKYLTKHEEWHTP
jgi:hypothetical protein